MDQQWTCKCGNVNSTKFCANCGAMHEAAEPQPQDTASQPIAASEETEAQVPASEPAAETAAQTQTPEQPMASATQQIYPPQQAYQPQQAYTQQPMYTQQQVNSQPFYGQQIPYGAQTAYGQPMYPPQPPYNQGYPPQQPYSQPQYQPPNYMNMAAQQPSSPDDELNNRRAWLIQKFTGSPLIIVLAILFSIETVLKIIDLFNVISAVSYVNEVSHYYSSYGYESAGRSAVGGAGFLSVIIALVPLVFSLCLAIGTWMLWGTSKTAHHSSYVKGIGPIRVTLLIQRVLWIVAMSILILLVIVAMSSASYIPERLIGVLLTTILILAGIMVIACLFYAALLKLVNSVDYRLGTPGASYTSCTSTAVWCFIFAALMLISIIWMESTFNSSGIYQLYSMLEDINMEFLLEFLFSAKDAIIIPGLLSTGILAVTGAIALVYNSVQTQIGYASRPGNYSNRNGY